MKKNLFLIVSLLLMGAQLVSSQTKVEGTVTDEESNPIPGVNVMVKGSSNMGTITDFTGSYSLQVPEGATTLVFSFVGMKTQEIEIGNQSEINVTMENDDVGIDEVIVVAYGTAKKSSYTGSAGVIDAENLETRTVTSVTQALEGSATGVQVTSSSGQPGSAPEIRIRGFGTLNGEASPLYVVDGAQYEGNIANINPEDIESMTILKDAASTALYGSRAANGVVMITTKKGKMGSGIVVSLKSVNGVISQAIPYYETADAKQYYELMFEAYKNALIYSSGETPEDAAQIASTGIYNRLNYNPFNVPNDQIVDVNGRINPNANVIFPSLNWYEPLEQVGFRQNHNLSIAGGGEKHDILFSVGYLDETGYVASSSFKRINGRMNFNVTPKKWLKIGSNFSGVITEKGFASGTTGNTSYANPFFFARNMGPIYPVYLIDPATGDYILDVAGEKQYDLGGGYFEYGINPRPSGANPGRHIVAELDYNNSETITNNLSNRTFVDFNITEGLRFSVQYAIDMDNYKYEEFENPIVGDGAPTGRYSELRYIRTTQNFNQLLSYQKSFANLHHMDVLFGHESFSRNYTNVDAMMSQLIVAGINEFDNYVTPTSLSGYTSDKRTEGYFGRLNYNYNGKYYFSTSYRFDGSSVFHKDVRWGGFFSVGGSWMLNKESFIESVKWINLLKIRSSYGEVGNDRIGSFYAYQALYSTFPNAESPGLVWSDVGNSELTWEVNKSFDVAIEFDLFDHRLYGSLEFYKKVSEDLLYNMPLPLSMGLGTQPRNIATLYNQGLEIGLGGKVISQDYFSWDINLMVSTVKNEITSIPDPFIDGSKRWAVGHSVYDFYLYDYYGVDTETGAALYYMWEADEETGETSRVIDTNGEPVLTENYNESERAYIGETAIPDFFGSITNNLRYKNFSLDFLLTYSIGGKILDYNYASLMNEGEYGQALHVDQINGWRKQGDETDIPRLEVGNNNIAPSLSSRWLTDASYLAIKNVNLSYTFNFAAIKNAGIKDLRLFVAGENLWMFNARKGMDSQEQFSGTTSNVYLPSRVVSVGVNISF